MHFNKKFGERLKIVRLANNLKQKEFAKEQNLNILTYGNYERGKRSPPTDLVFKICQKYNINYNWLFTGKGPMVGHFSSIDTDLLEKIIIKIEEYLQQYEITLSNSKRAEIISLLYEEGSENSDTDTLEKKLIRFVKLAE